VCGRTEQLYLLVVHNDMLCDVMCCVEWWHVFFVLMLKCTSQCLGHPECSEFHEWFHLWVENNHYAFLSISGQGHCSGLLLLEDVILCHCIPCYMQLGLKLFCLWNCMNSVRQIGSGCIAVCEVFDPISHTSGFIQSQLTLSAAR